MDYSSIKVGNVLLISILLKKLYFYNNSVPISFEAKNHTFVSPAFCSETLVMIGPINS